MRYVAPDIVTGDFAPLGVPAPKPDRQEARPFQFLDCDPELRLRRLVGRWPDWQDSSSYSYVDGLGLKALGWEFLRRNPHYINEYHKWKFLHSQANAGHKADIPCYWEYVCAVSVGIAQRYGLHVERYPPSPSLDEPPLIRGESLIGEADVLMVGEGQHDRPTVYSKPPEKGVFAVLCIYPDRSEKEQIDTIRYYLRELRQVEGMNLPKPKTHISIPHMKVYLQILDAKAAWAESNKIAQITKIIHHEKVIDRETPPLKQLSRDYKQARELALEGYKRLFAASIHE